MELTFQAFQTVIIVTWPARVSGSNAAEKLLHDAYVLLKNQDTIDRMADRDSKQIEANLKNALEYERQLNQQILGRKQAIEEVVEKLMKLLIDKATERHKVDE